MEHVTLGEVAQFLTALTAFGAFVSSLLNRKKLRENSKTIEQVHLATNSMKDELIAEVRVAEHARGVKETKDAVAAATAEKK